MTVDNMSLQFKVLQIVIKEQLSIAIIFLNKNDLSNLVDYSELCGISLKDFKHNNVLI